MESLKKIALEVEKLGDISKLGLPPKKEKIVRRIAEKRLERGR